jgi:hypothetical protein
MIIDLKLDGQNRLVFEILGNQQLYKKKQHSSWNLEAISLTCRFQWSSFYDIASTTAAYFRCRKLGHLWI